MIPVVGYSYLRNKKTGEYMRATNGDYLAYVHAPMAVRKVLAQPKPTDWHVVDDWWVKNIKGPVTLRDSKTKLQLTAQMSPVELKDIWQTATT